MEAAALRSVHNQQGLRISSLPDLSGLAALQVVDLDGAQLLGGTIPPAFGSMRLTAFRCAVAQHVVGWPTAR
jgi:hypothetical protein